MHPKMEEKQNLTSIVLTSKNHQNETTNDLPKEQNETYA